MLIVNRGDINKCSCYNRDENSPSFYSRL